MNSKLTIYGGQRSNYIVVKKRIMNEDEINSLLQQETTTPDWDEDTIFLADWKNNINGSNFTGVNENIVEFSLFRKPVNKDVLYHVANVPSTQKTIEDYMAGHNVEFEYWNYPVLETGGVRKFANPIVTKEASINCGDFTVVGTVATDTPHTYLADKSNVWMFNLNVDPGTTSIEMNKNISEGYTKFPKVINGNRCYKKGGLNTLFGNISYTSCKYDTRAELLNAWSEFCASDCLKILKDASGTVTPIEIISSSYNQSADGKLTTISFSYVQVENFENVSVYGVVDI